MPYRIKMYPLSFFLLFSSLCILFASVCHGASKNLTVPDASKYLVSLDGFKSMPKREQRLLKAWIIRPTRDPVLFLEVVNEISTGSKKIPKSN